MICELCQPEQRGAPPSWSNSGLLYFLLTPFSSGVIPWDTSWQVEGFQQVQRGGREARFQKSCLEGPRGVLQGFKLCSP